MSIKRQLTLLTISTFVLATFLAALHGYRNSLAQLDELFDQELRTVAALLVNLVESDSRIPTDFDGELAFQVIQQGVVTKTSNNVTRQQIANLPAGFSEQSFNGKRWRVFRVAKVEFDVIVMQPINLRAASAESILRVTITPIILTIPLIALLIYYIIKRSLSGLISLSHQLKRKTANDLTTVSLQDSPDELVPVVERLNSLFERLAQSFERERELTANAAHELRTPISVLTLTAHNLEQDFTNQQLSAAGFYELKQNIQRMAHVIEQMIALYRFSPEQFSSEMQQVDIQQVLQDVISGNFTEIDNNQQSIELDAQQCMVHGDYFALYTLFENIVRNSIKYAGVGAKIQVATQRNGQQIEIIIEDSGKGVDDAELDKVFSRFYRSESAAIREKGSGLGLSIVAHIVTLHHGKVAVSRSTLGGLKTQVNLPAGD
ncbi:sensor histidine kinase [Alteromonas flava]|uniref:sensor histidine kinase n=1 Tax=Alteromonas flava TaxID=2048003 RepID=UPI000C286AE1|nr:ATP-binding protein [Alteromonas flava]